MSGPLVTVFGGTGFLGRQLVRRLLAHHYSVRIAARRPDQARTLFGADPRLHSVAADIHDDASLATALDGAFAAVNAVGLYVERGRATFHSVHVAGARRLAAQARKAGVQRFVHVSGIGADASSPSPYIRARGQGELAVRESLGEAIIVRPAVMFGPDDVFLTSIRGILRWSPVFPLFGKGTTRLQPAHVDDVAEGVVRLVERPELRALTVEFGGPRVYQYRELVGAIASTAGLRSRLLSLPFPLWHAVAAVAEWLPNPPLTRNQVELVQIDNVASPAASRFAELGIVPRSVEDTIQRMAAQAATMAATS